MRDERTFAATLACPTCGTPGRRIVVALVTSDGRHEAEEEWALRVHDCSACWSLRASCLARAREGLRATGDLGETSAHQSTWQGAIVRDGGAHDPITGAILSSLLRHGLRATAGAHVRLSATSLGLVAAVAAGGVADVARGGARRLGSDPHDGPERPSRDPEKFVKS